MNEDQYKVVLERIDNIQSTVDRIDRDLAQDRRDLQEFSLRLGGLENQVEEFRRTLYSQADKVKDKVEDLVQPVEKKIDSLTEEIQNKRVIVIKDKFKGFLFWRR